MGGDTGLSDLGRPERKATLRLSQRELSRISTAVVGLVVLVVVFLGYRVFLNFKSQRDIVVAKTNLHMIYTAVRHYAEDWDGRFPAAANWTDSIAGYLSAARDTPGGSKSYLNGPGDGATIGYVYNDLASRYELEPTGPATRLNGIDPGRIVLLIERPGAKPNAHVRIPPLGSAQGDSALFKQLSFPHYSDDPKSATTIVLFANGNVVTYTRQDFN